MPSALSLAMNRAFSEAYDLKNIVEALDPVPDAKIKKAHRLGLPAVERTAVMGPPPSPNRDPYPYVGMVNYHGILIYIENEPGSIREGIDTNGQPWRIKMTHLYGEIPGTSGADGDPVDVYIGPNPSAPTAFVIHQETHIGHEHAIQGAYDEDKVMLGFSTREEAIRAYADHFSYPVMVPGVTPLPVAELRQRVDDGELNFGAAVVKARGHKYISRKKVKGVWVYTYPPKAKPKPKPARQHPGRKAPGSQLPVKVQKRLRELGVSKLPAGDIPLSAITINTQTSGIHTRAVISWRDTGGRRQNGYTPKFHEENAAKKWKRVLRFRNKVPGLKRKFAKAIRESEPGSLEHQTAVVGALLAATGLRPGNEPSVAAGRYGLTTLNAEHVDVRDASVAFEFVGKSGKVNTAFIRNRQLAEAVQHYAKDGARLFTPQVLDSIRKAMPKGMLLKDFRTILATEAAVKALNAVLKPPPLTGDKKKDKRLLLKAIRAASSKVARALNNTTAVAKQSYIHPMVFEQWARDTVGAQEALWKRK